MQNEVCWRGLIRKNNFVFPSALLTSQLLLILSFLPALKFEVLAQTNYNIDEVALNAACQAKRVGMSFMQEFGGK